MKIKHKGGMKLLTLTDLERKKIKEAGRLLSLIADNVAEDDLNLSKDCYVAFKTCSELTKYADARLSL